MSVWAHILRGLTPSLGQGLQEGVDRYQLGQLQSRLGAATTPEERTAARGGFRPELLARFDANTEAENKRQIAALTLRKLGFDVDVAGSNARVATGTEGDRMQIPGLQREGLETKNKADAAALKNAPLLQALNTEKLQSEIVKNRAAAAKSMRPGKASVYQFTTKDGESGTVFADDRQGIQDIIEAGGRVFAGVASDTVSSFDPTKKTKQGAQEAVLEANKALSTLDQMQKEYDPEIFTYESRITDWLKGKQEQLGFDLTKEAKAKLEKNTSYKQQVSANLNALIHTYAGGAVSANELERMLSQVPNITDSATEFKAKLDATVSTLKRMIKADYSVLETGLPTRQPEQDVASIIEQMTPEQIQAFLAATE